MTGKDDQYTCNTLAKLTQNNNILNNISFVLHSLMNCTLNNKSTGSNIQTVKYTVLHSLLHACLRTHIRKTRIKKAIKMSFHHSFKANHIFSQAEDGCSRV